MAHLTALAISVARLHIGRPHGNLVASSPGFLIFSMHTRKGGEPVREIMCATSPIANIGSVPLNDDIYDRKVKSCPCNTSPTPGHFAASLPGTWEVLVEQEEDD